MHSLPIEPNSGREAGNVVALPSRKADGTYLTAEATAATLVAWAVRGREDRMLDPSCRAGMFVAAHARGVGVERDAGSGRLVRERAPSGEIHVDDFFAWADLAGERFDCSAGNPPFIRYQRFAGETRALRVCREFGPDFTGLTSSWAPLLVATASLFLPDDRTAFAVLAEIGHAPYAAPFPSFAVGRFSTVHLVAIWERLFPGPSEDCWLLFADGFGDATAEIRLSVVDRFVPSRAPPDAFEWVDVREGRTA